MVDGRAPTKVIVVTLALVGVSDAGAQLWLGGKVSRAGDLTDASFTDGRRRCWWVPPEGTFC